MQARVNPSLMESPTRRMVVNGRNDTSTIASPTSQAQPLLAAYNGHTNIADEARPPPNPKPKPYPTKRLFLADFCTLLR